MTEVLPAGVAVRQRAQEIIAAYVLSDDAGLCDRLIEEYASAHAGLLDVVYGFVQFHVVTSVEPVVAEDRFQYMLDAAGRLIEVLAEAQGVGPESVLARVVERIDERLCDVDAPAETWRATHAAQTCLAVHLAVRAGDHPIGIQKNLALEDMCVIVHHLDVIMNLLIRLARGATGDAAVIRYLLDNHIVGVLRVQAEAHRLPLLKYIEAAWTELARRDVERPM